MAPDEFHGFPTSDAVQTVVISHNLFAMRVRKHLQEISISSFSVTKNIRYMKSSTFFLNGNRKILAETASKLISFSIYISKLVTVRA